MAKRLSAEALAETFKKHYNITWLHQSGAALLLGTIVGFVVWYVRRDPMYQDDGSGESQRMTSFVEWIM